MPKYGADGDVLEVSLTTVKVRNFDKTITTIPPYALVSDSFQNWRGMRETGGRRIKRSIFIDMTTVHFCSEKEKIMFASRGWIDEAQAKPETQVVNLYVFRNYLQNYLREHPRTHKELMIMVRQMQPTSEGLPLEIYCFSNTTVWLEYEQIQGEIFDHILAVIPEFGLRIFQRPSGNDLSTTNQIKKAIMEKGINLYLPNNCLQRKHCPNFRIGRHGSVCYSCFSRTYGECCHECCQTISAERFHNGRSNDSNFTYQTFRTW